MVFYIIPCVLLESILFIYAWDFYSHLKINLKGQTKLIVKNKIWVLIQGLPIQPSLCTSIISRQFISHNSFIFWRLGFHNKILVVFLLDYLFNILVWISIYRLILHICKFLLKECWSSNILRHYIVPSLRQIYMHFN